MLWAEIGVLRLTAPAPVAPKIASSPSAQIVGAVQFTLFVFQRESAEVFSQVLTAARVCNGAKAASIRLAAINGVYLFMILDVWVSCVFDLVF